MAFLAGRAIIDIYPSMKGFKSSVTSELRSASTSFSGFGKKAGAGFSRDFQRSTNVGISTLKNNVVNAENAIAKARNNAAVTAKRLEAAELRVSELRSSAKSKASTIANAEASLLRARANNTYALQNVTRATQSYNSAQLRLNTALTSNVNKGSIFQNSLSALKNGATAAATGVSNLAASIASKLGTAAKTVGIGALVAGIGTLASAIPAAIQRIDDMARAPKVLQNIGMSSEDAKASIEDMMNYVQGLPLQTTEVTSTMTRLYDVVGQNAEKARALTKAVYDSMLAGGTGAEQARVGVEQFTQALGRMATTGAFGAQEWRTMIQTAPAQMRQLAQELLGVEATAGDLGEALSNGEIKTQDFIDALIRLDTEGGDGIAAFSTQTRDAVKGIGTDISNAKMQITFLVADFMSMLSIDPETSNLASGVKKFREWFSENESIKRFTESLRSLFESEGFRKSAEILLTITAALASIAFDTLAGFLDGITEGFNAFNTALESFDMEGLDTEGILNFFNGLGHALGIIASAGMFVFGGIGMAKQALEDFTTKIQENETFQTFSSILSNIGNTIYNIGSIAFNVMQTIGNFFASLIAPIFAPIQNFLSAIWEKASPLLSTVGNWFLSVGSTISSYLSSFLNFLNSISSTLSSLTSKIRNVTRLSSGLGDIASLQSVINVRHTGGGIPKFARGAYVTSPTVALIGEAGAEALFSDGSGTSVIPLENNLGWIDKVAANINANTTPSSVSEAKVVQNNTFTNVNPAEVVAIIEQYLYDGIGARL